MKSKVKETKGKLYISFAASVNGNSNQRTEVFHGVRKSNVENVVARKRGREILETWFSETKTNRQMRIHGGHHTERRTN